ncbi:hypothetical protein [Micromonospora vulcania]|uniref:Uncharacterized protein n=1 Tax=Micromonospora vulcania TaxID=1441873 RepID=A0ABW1HA21_9ACTN
MRKPIKRAVLAVAVAAALLIGVSVAVAAVRRSQEIDLSVNSYRVSDGGRLLDAQVDVHPDFDIVRAEADETDDRVLLRVSARQPALWWSGADVAQERTVRVMLSRPLNGRTVVDAHTGAVLTNQ